MKPRIGKIRKKIAHPLWFKCYNEPFDRNSKRFFDTDFQTYSIDSRVAAYMHPFGVS